MQPVHLVPWPTLCGEVYKLAIELPIAAPISASPKREIEVVEAVDLDDKEGPDPEGSAVTTATTIPTAESPDSR